MTQRTSVTQRNSHGLDETQGRVASPGFNENQAEGASQTKNENQATSAKQELAARMRLMVDQYSTVQQARIRMGNRRLAIANVREVSPDSISIPGIDEAMEKIEDGYKRHFAKALETLPIYTEFLSKVRGVGPVLSAQLIGHIGDIGRFGRVSDLWHYAGYHVEDGSAVKLQRGKEVTWNPALKRACFNVGQSFVRGGRYYRTLYDEVKPKEAQKHRENGCKRGKDCSEKLHIDNRARRKIIKMFLSNLWEAWRELEGLPKPPPYAIEYLGHGNFVSWKEVIAYESKEPSSE